MTNMRDKEKAKAYQKEYRQKNLDKLQAYIKEYQIFNLT